MRKKNDSMKKWGVPALFFILFFTTFWVVATYTRIDINDMKGHVLIAIQFFNGEIALGTPILYGLMIICSFFSTDIESVTLSLCLLLALATSFRYYLAQKDISSLNVYTNQNKNYWLSVIVALSLIVVFVIPIPSFFINGNMYIGNFTPNVWHNSTTIFLFPFAILLYNTSLKQFDNYSRKRDALIFILILLNLLIKPSFFFAFACAYPLIMVVRYKLNKTFWKSMLPLVGGFFVMAIVAWIFYNPENETGSSIIFSPFGVYKLYGSMYQLPFTLFFSFLFPILYIHNNIEKLRKNFVFWYTVSLAVFGLMIYFFIAEGGPRYSHGNMYWQIVICTWLLYFFTLKALLKDIKEEGLSIKNALLLSIYSLHVIIGVIYLIRFLLFTTPF